jgi:FtsH-binding integral membrane protein
MAAEQKDTSQIVLSVRGKVLDGGEPTAPKARHKKGVMPTVEATPLPSTAPVAESMSHDAEAPPAPPAAAYPLPGTVDAMPMGIQRAFRAKMLGLLCLQLVFMLLLGVAVDLAGVTLPFFPWSSLFWGMVLLNVSLAVLKGSYPLNYALLALFTLASALWIGTGNPHFRSHTHYMVFGLSAVLTCTLSVNACRENTYDDPRNPTQPGDPPKLRAFGDSYFLGWCLMLVVAVVVQATLGTEWSTWPHWVQSVLFASCLCGWFAYDAKQICRLKTPDDYMEGFLSMWADCFKMFAACAALCCACHGNSDAAV